VVGGKFNRRQGPVLAVAQNVEADRETGGPRRPASIRPGSNVERIINCGAAISKRTRLGPDYQRSRGPGPYRDGERSIPNYTSFSLGHVSNGKLRSPVRAIPPFAKTRQ